jgi:hypothetical protein
MSDQDQQDDSAESASIDPDGEGEREAGAMQGEPAEESDEILREEQQGKGYGSG